METVFVALRVVLSLAVVLGLLWALHRRISRGNRARVGSNPIAIVGRQAVGQKAAVVIVEVDGHRMLLGVTDQQVNVLRQEEIRRPTIDDIEFTRIMAESAEVGRPQVSTPSVVTDAPALPAHPTQAARPTPAALPAALSGALPAPTATADAAPAPAPMLTGSILSAATWKQAAAAMRLTK